jgi:class 3 adenylate cyclase/tetratricopeptide (TPR) repeat protein
VRSFDGEDSLLGQWQVRAKWINDVDKARGFVERAIREGEFLVAYDAALEARDQHRDDDWLRQQMALALAQMGSTNRARKILIALAEKNPTDRETLSLLGRTWKDEWCADPTNDYALAAAFEWYGRAFEIEPPEYYPGINAASLALLRGDEQIARSLADRVLAICHEKLVAPNPGELYWITASLAEALAILDRRDESKETYKRASQVPNLSLRELSSTRRQARLLSKHLYARPDIFDECFPIPKLVVFSGHMLDPPSRRVPRFPPHKEGAVREAIEKQLETMNAGIGFSSAACGSDILFLEAMLNRGAAIHVVLPWPREEFIRSSIDIAQNEAWTERCERVLQRAASIRVLGELEMPVSPVGLEYCNAAMIGLARLYAQSVDLDIAPMAVWDGMLGAPGGTGSFVRYWRTHGVPVKIIPLTSEPATQMSETATQETIGLDADDDFETWVRAAGRQEIKAIMFADVAGYTKLAENAVPKFVAQFNQRVSTLLARSSSGPININTWGDAFFFVFNRVEDAGQFALDLRDLVTTTNWSELGLPSDLNIRIALHAGPVYVSFDPVSRQVTFAGAHVVRAARIEPITHKGEAFASEEFAALAASEEASGFRCDFIGTTQLPKKYGAFRIYSLARAEKRPKPIILPTGIV